MRVLSIDPGLGITGFSILESKAQKIQVVAYGTIKSKSKDSVPERLNYIFQEMTKILNKFMPNSLAIEDAFYSNNVKSAMVLGQARGAVILSGAQAKIPIYEFAPRKVKMSVCGNGAATKEQVAFMVSRILQLSEQPKPLDVTDAMAVGICFFNQEKLF